jgi:hypothetical protein
MQYPCARTQPPVDPDTRGIRFVERGRGGDNVINISCGSPSFKLYDVQQKQGLLGKG